MSEERKELGWVPVKITRVVTCDVYVGTPDLPARALQHVWEQSDIHGHDAFMNATSEIIAAEWLE